jgi:hypothetical protein
VATEPTPEQLDRRRAAGRRHAHRKLDRKNADPRALRCALDGFAFRYRTNGRGRDVRYCPACEWRRSHRCQDCGNPVRGRSWRCDRHKAIAKRVQLRAHAARNREEILRRHREALKRMRVEDRPRYEHRLATKKAWRQRNVVRIKLQKRKWRLNPNRPNGYSSREKYEAYHAAYRAKHAARRRELAKRNYYRLHPDRPHPICACGCNQAIPWDGHGRPRKWLPAHDPWPRSLTALEVFVKMSSKALASLKAAREKIQKKLAGVAALQREQEALDKAIAALESVAGEGVPDITPARRGRGAAAGGGQVARPVARIRSIHPDFPSDKKLAKVPRDARLAFVCCWCIADDAGLFRAEPRQLLGALFPHDHDVADSQLEAWLADLVSIGVLRWRQTRDGARVGPGRELAAPEDR